MSDLSKARLALNTAWVLLEVGHPREALLQNPATRYKLSSLIRMRCPTDSSRGTLALDCRQQLETLTMQRRRPSRYPTHTDEANEPVKEPIDLTAEFEQASAESVPTHVDELNRAATAPIDLMGKF